MWNTFTNIDTSSKFEKNARPLFTHIRRYRFGGNEQSSEKAICGAHKFFHCKVFQKSFLIVHNAYGVEGNIDAALPATSCACRSLQMYAKISAYIRYSYICKLCCCSLSCCHVYITALITLTGLAPDGW